ncbi:family 78 glycoside hydrolase catalytic domain [Arcicella sp. LKC2W]|uniref:alpha-L-rhamnosidase n=1 Tax=Arcicella sp. LKC2W TaxID=2984198 RepID=UPI002B2165F9|nr:family 78 glycoside hydrolase catalytic domain [Arcicella sp. LKC2W]MEA5460396.1 family 78 glycoside hydrolase catalytic domain [Arcicella sp. LKC2W]
MIKKLSYFLLTLLFLSFKQEEKAINLTHLRCELLVNPVGIEVINPRLSWEIKANLRGVEQTAYQIVVASSVEKLAKNDGDLWDSGKVISSETIHNRYTGKPLKSRQACFWKVKIWTNKGETAWAENASFSIGLRNYVDWKGRWIGLDRSFAWDTESQFSRLSARYFRKEFTVNKEIKHATANIIGLGMYELYFNGQKVGNQVLAPVPTDYNKGVKYNSFDVTSLLKSGNNAIGTILGNGRFYTMRQDYKPYKIKTFGYPKMLFNLDIEYTDGTKATIVSDDSWKVTADGAIRTNNEYDGEEYDAAKELTGWNKAGYVDTDWLKAEFVQEAGGNYEAQMTENMKVMETLKPLSIKKIKENTYILDMGQNMAGWVRMRVQGKRGDKVSLRFGENIQANGELYVRNLRDAKSTDIYTLKGEGTEIWEPTFVYHGFRYVEISNFPTEPTIENFDGRVVYDDMETVGNFSTSNNTINQVFKNAYWGIRSNYKGMPVDCPQRNERQPWLGDRTTGAYGESFIFDNHNLYAKWLDDIQQAQKADGSIPDVAPAFWRYYGDNVTWPSTYISVASMLFRQFGDQEVIKKHYSSMKKWMDYMAEKYTENGIVTKDKYGDWCVPPESKELIHAKDTTRITDGKLIAAATYIQLLATMQDFAQLLEKNDDKKVFASLSLTMQKAFNQQFLKQEKTQYSNGTVTANLLPIVYDIVPKENKKAVFNTLIDKILTENKGHISTGVIGTQWLMRGLTQNGRSDIAYQLATNTDYPSWGYMAENGATTIWELWNGNTANPEMNSANHVMLLGDLIVWYYENLAGIKSESNAFKTIIMKPEIIEKLEGVKASYHSIRGEISSEWKNEAGQFSWKISIPPNTKALLYLPTNSIKNIKESNQKISQNKSIKFLKIEQNKVVLEVESGSYEFVVNQFKH